jgi:hypothetical protein
MGHLSRKALIEICEIIGFSFSHYGLITWVESAFYQRQFGFKVALVFCILLFLSTSVNCSMAVHAESRTDIACGCDCGEDEDEVETGCSFCEITVRSQSESQ